MKRRKIGTKLYVTVKTLSTNNNVKLLHQLKSGFKRTTEKNKDQSKVLIEEDYLIDPIFWRLNRLSIL